MTNPADAPLRTALEIALERAEAIAVLAAIAGEAGAAPIKWPMKENVDLGEAYRDMWRIAESHKLGIWGIDPSQPKA